MSALSSAVIAGLVSLVVAAIAARASIMSVQKQYKLEDAAERVARELLSDQRWNWRTFRIMQHHLSGFEPNELRKLLVRAGAIRVNAANGEEMWGLLSRNREFAGMETIGIIPTYSPKPNMQQQQQD